MSLIAKIGFGFLLVFFGLPVCIAVVMPNPDTSLNANANNNVPKSQLAKTVDGEKPEPTKPPIEITASKLYREYDKNEVAAQQKFRNRTVKLTGIVVQISADFMDDPIVQLRGKSRYQTVDVHGMSAAEAAKLSKRDKIVVTCTDVTEIIGTPVCQL